MVIQSYHNGGVVKRYLAPLLLTGLLAAQAPAPVKKALFWKASSENNVVYLLGSVHVGSKAMYPLAPQIEDAFDRSTVLIEEVDLSSLDMQKIQALVMQLGRYPEGDSLWNHISPETRKLLEQFCADNGVPVESLAPMKTWMVESSVNMIPLLKQGMALELGIDKYFADKSKGKQRVGIETTEEQLQMFAGFSDELAEKALSATLRNAATQRDRAKHMEEAWIAGDAEALDKMITAEGAEQPPEIQKAVRENRNPRMADAAEKVLKSKDVGFVVVGAAHLVGKDGVIGILQKRGYKVEQLTLKK
jgi:hypothetical protein